MCLALPARLTETERIGDNLVGKVDLGGVERSVFLNLVPEAKTGDFVLMHADFAINLLSEQEARETLQLLEAIGATESETTLRPT